VVGMSFIRPTGMLKISNEMELESYFEWPESWLLVDAAKNIVALPFTGSLGCRVCHRCNRLAPSSFGIHAATYGDRADVCCATCWVGCEQTIQKKDDLMIEYCGKTFQLSTNSHWDCSKCGHSAYSHFYHSNGRRTLGECFQYTNAPVSDEYNPCLCKQYVLWPSSWHTVNVATHVVG
jgi:hypothetical protein